MDGELDSERLSTALARFRHFFDELRALYLERDDLLAQAAMALLTREHFLITGPPGTAKSSLTPAIVGRIVDERTGEPSVFSRQVTESTVHTDLVGPIDFKALTETGRTQHFTDEGLLGAVHAHLDEILDGRDMLLRSTLNLLNERELKQGTKIVKGAIECAIMTTNRYLAEVLEDSRERLLAFVDRVAFVGFVPKGFADPAHLERVLEVQAGGRRPPAPGAILTIQDVDVLQRAADMAYVDPALFRRLAQLVTFFEEECAEAVRADPSFVPTRYLSTRTVVRLGRALKAACVLQAAWSEPERDLAATPQDLELLRLSLLLSGPTPTEVSALLERETDPRERRQLEILRTERELFARARERLPEPPPMRARPRGATVVGRGVTATAPGATEATEEQASAEPDALLLADALSGMTTALASEEDPITAAQRLADRADKLERRGGRDEARWLRGRALALVADALGSADAALGQGLKLLLDSDRRVEWIRSAADARVYRLERATELRTRLRAKGADEAEPSKLDDALSRALRAATHDLGLLWQEGFASAVEIALERAPADSLELVLTEVRPALEHIAEADRALERLGVVRSTLRADVVGPRIAPLLESVWRRFSPSSREAVVDEVRRMREQLHAAGLRAVVPPAAQLEWASDALLRSAVDVPSAPPSLDRDGYRELRRREPRTSLAYVIVHVFVEILADTDYVAPAEAIERLRALSSTLPDVLRAELREADLRRIARALELLERFWERLEGEALASVRETDEESVSAALRALEESGFFELATDEAVLARFELEAALLAEIIPDARDAVSELRARASALASKSRARLDELLALRAEARWARVVGP